MSSLFEEGIRHGYIEYDLANHEVMYSGCKTKRSLHNPEEKVQVEAYVFLAHRLHYPVAHIKVCHPVKMGSSRREADIVVFTDSSCTHPSVVVECKRSDLSGASFQEAIEQGFSYASASGAKYLWVTSQKQNAYFEYWHQRPAERNANQLPSLPSFGKADSKLYQLKKNSWQKLQQLQAILGKKGIQWLSLVAFQTPFFILFTFLFFWAFVVFAQPIHYLPWQARLFFAPFVATGITSLFAPLIMITSWNWLKKQHTSVSYRSVLVLTVPYFITGFAFSDLWWNLIHYQKMVWREWLFLQPFALVVAIQLASVFIIFSIRKK